MLMGTLSGIEMGLQLAGMPHKKGGVMAALDRLEPAGKATVLELGGRATHAMPDTLNGLQT
jgi:alanine-glyoxylate transaminase/serine-glyoxylate transaminase/serine-pyruvate transaminase